MPPPPYCDDLAGICLDGMYEPPDITDDDAGEDA